jgi:hypothetical protein
VRYSRRRSVTPDAAGDPRPALGVTYTTSDHAPGLKLFRCEPLRATLSDRGCGKRWREAQSATMTPAELAALAAAAKVHATIEAKTHGHKQPGSQYRLAVARNRTSAVQAHRAHLDTCRSCPIGAAHAGAVHVVYSRIFGAAICPRCRRGATRMIGGKVCVSCYNRGRELSAGKNARGNAPRELQARAPRPLEIRIAIDGLATGQSVVAVDRAEVMIQALRTTKGAVEFGYAPVGLALKERK